MDIGGGGLSQALPDAPLPIDCRIAAVDKRQTETHYCDMNSQDMNGQIEEILRGCYDLHVHAAPDGSRERRMDALEVARCAYEAEMGGFALKSHDYNTAPLAYALNRMYPGLKALGAIALNRAVGGVNPDAVQAAADLGAQVVWMPTFSADFWQRNRGGGKREGLRVANDDGSLGAGVGETLEIIAANDMTVASGHIAPSEAIALFAAAKAQGVRRMIATHPGGAASLDERRRMIALGAYAECAFLACMPARATMTPVNLVETLRALGVANCIVTTALGQWMNPPPAEGMRMAIAALLDAGMSADEVSTLVKRNPAQLLGVE